MFELREREREKHAEHSNNAIVENQKHCKIWKLKCYLFTRINTRKPIQMISRIYRGIYGGWIVPFRLFAARDNIHSPSFAVYMYDMLLYPSRSLAPLGVGVI